MYYSKSTGGFYDREIHGDNIPSDAVTISDETHQKLMEGQAAGMVIASDKNGNPVLVEPAPPTPEEKQKQINLESKAYLNSTDWYVVRRSETGGDIPQEILDKRAAARLAIVE